eukprot:TRINITY_DN7_c0_g1_i11.p1 TRINITY_DN7_c0_g1~~TRINITY_DN7_c0_g1_i11.p1  ORF type:complete len:229 (+),score=72.99 TRINITY_DN7_c0_g1_i11:47-688(+)
MFNKMMMLAATVAVAEGIAIKWTGIVNDQQWTTPNNWYPAQVPGPYDTVTIDDAEGKDAIVVLVQPAVVGSLTMGNNNENNARLRVLAPLTVNSYISVQPNGVLEINSGAASLTCGNTVVAGQLNFGSGVLSTNATITGLANISTQAAKVFLNSNIKVISSQTVLASGSLQFKQSSSFVTDTGVTSQGMDFQCIVMDQSTGNKFHSSGFNWGN